MRLSSDLYRKRGDAGAVVENKPGEVVDMSLEDRVQTRKPLQSF